MPFSSKVQASALALKVKALALRCSLGLEGPGLGLEV